jgi:hypothetical protein
MKWFIKRPHAIEQFRARAGFPENADSVLLETELRRVLDALNDADLKQGCREGELAAKVAIEGRNVVYAIIKPAKNKDYNYTVPTVITATMYEAWAKDGRLGDLSELPVEKKKLPDLKPRLYLRHPNGDGQPHFHEYCVDDIPEQVAKLLDAGVAPKDIKVLKEIPFKIDISLLGFSSSS